LTAAADALAGFWIGQASQWGTRPELAAAVCLLSVCFYAAGVILNDVADVNRDRLSRPNRPLPSGAISVRTAARIGILLLLAGWTGGMVLASILGTPYPWTIGSLLALTILAYDFWLKSTLAGPLVMGLCRSLNLLLGITVGLAASKGEFYSVHLGVAALLGMYVTGITVFARRETESSPRGTLIIGLMIMILAFGCLGFLPYWPLKMRWPQPVPPVSWLGSVGVAALIVSLRGIQAVADPRPQKIQRAVRQAVLWIIVWDTILCFAFAGKDAALLILLLLVPAVILAAWIDPT
jgi:4-hydroxybenzoate polyprenyltransferase